MRKDIKSFIETENQTNCTSTGYCALNPTIEIIEELFLNEVRQISYYISKFPSSDFYDANLLSELIAVLAEDIFATQPIENDVSKKLKHLINLRNLIKKKYMEFCKNSMQGCEIANFAYEPDVTLSYPSFIENAARYIYVRNKTFTLQQLRFFELITSITKATAQTISKIKLYKPDFSDYDRKLLKFFSITALFSDSLAKLKRKILQFSSDVYVIRKIYTETLNEYFGERVDAKIRTSLLAGKSLLVSGSNLKELEEILSAASDGDINVYTHGELYVAHTYKKFKNFQNLKGHIASGSINYDFSNFDGVIFVTKFMGNKIDQLYQGTVFSSSDIVSKGMIRVENNDYSQIFDAIGMHSEARADKVQTFEVIELINEDFNELFLDKHKQVVIFLGKTKGYDLISQFGDKKIINIEYQSDSDLFYKIIEKSQKEEIPVTLFCSRCSSRVIADIVSVLSEKTVEEIFMVRCKTFNVNPHVIECLRDEFDVKIIE